MRSFAPLLWAALLLWTALAVGTAAPVHAGQVSLVADLAPGPARAGDPTTAEEDASSAPRQLLAAGGRAVFLTDNRNHGDPANAETRLWGTDGTESGTELLAVLCTPPAVCNVEPAMLGSLEDQGVVLFRAGTGDYDYMALLWRTDGTRAGTYPITGPLSHISSRFARLGALYSFLACTPGFCSLWHTDGTVAGTGPGRPLDNDSIVVFKGRLFYQTQGLRAALWTSDGSQAGTRIVRSLPEGMGGQLSVAGSRMYFTTNSPEGTTLWVSDGTRAGTRFVKEFLRDANDRFQDVSFLKPWRDRIVFLARDRSRFRNLWMSDGTAQGTRSLTRFAGDDVAYLREDHVAGLGDRLYFLAGQFPSGLHLWCTRGTSASTAPLSGCPVGCPTFDGGAPLATLPTGVLLPASEGLFITNGIGSDTSRLYTGPVNDIVPAGNFVYFGAGSSLWRTDGTLTGTERLGDLADPYARNSRRLDLVPLGSRAVFAGSDPEHGEQPWVTDGTPEGTRLLANLGGGGASSMPADLTSLEDRLLFTAENGEARSVWSSDGTAAGTLALAGAGLDSSPPAGLVRAGGVGYFSQRKGPRSELWRTDGTPAGTFAVAEFPDRVVSQLSEVGGQLVALISSTFGERPVHSLWTSDGTPAGTRKILDMADEMVEIGSWIPLGSELFFTAARETRMDVYRTDGTAAGTRAILEIGCFNCTLRELPIEAVRKADGTVILFAQGPEDGGRNVWQTDGTPEGTVALLPSPITGLNRIEWPTAPAALGNDVVFFAASVDVDLLTRWSLWRLRGSDLTPLSPAGTAGYDWMNLKPPVADGHGHLLFSAWDRDHGRELWGTDGDPAGTALLADLLSGPESSNPEGLALAGGWIVFSAQDGIHGRELWTTDGTASGTRLLDDIAPGGASSSPRSFTAVGDKLFFTADDGTTGREPWVRPLDF